MFIKDREDCLLVAWRAKPCEYINMSEKGSFKSSVFE